MSLLLGSLSSLFCPARDPSQGMVPTPSVNWCRTSMAVIKPIPYRYTQHTEAHLLGDLGFCEVDSIDRRSIPRHHSMLRISRGDRVCLYRWFGLGRGLDINSYSHACKTATCDEGRFPVDLVSFPVSSSMRERVSIHRGSVRPGPFRCSILESQDQLSPSCFQSRRIPCGGAIKVETPPPPPAHL